MPAVTSSHWTDESESEGNPGCDSCNCNSSLVPYSYNPGAGQTADDTYLTASSFPAISIPAGHYVSSVKIDVMCRFYDGTSGQVRARANVNGADLPVIDTPAFVSGTTCQYRLGALGDITSQLPSGWNQAAIDSMKVKIRRVGDNQTTLRVKAFKLTVTTAPAPLPCPAAGDCCDAHPNPGCADSVCCNSVCVTDLLCCEVEWDQTCAVTAGAICGICPVCGDGICEGTETWPNCPDCLPATCPAQGDCCVPHATPGCDEATCCINVCNSDSFCCAVAWDAVCVNEASSQCGGCTSCGDGVCDPGESWPSCPDCTPLSCPGAGSCCDDHATAGCSDADCCQFVCIGDPSCCTTAWDTSCVALAQKLCGLCGNPDINGDGHVGPTDLGLLLGQWGHSGTADLDGDGHVGASDLAILLGAWG
ncbi:MAG: hypothetical protein U0572_00130 [Phycisphaerales bacterium]